MHVIFVPTPMHVHVYPPPSMISNENNGSAVCRSNLSDIICTISILKTRGNSTVLRSQTLLEIIMLAAELVKFVGTPMSSKHERVAVHKSGTGNERTPQA